MQFCILFVPRIFCVNESHVRPENPLQFPKSRDLLQIPARNFPHGILPLPSPARRWYLNATRHRRSESDRKWMLALRWKFGLIPKCKKRTTKLANGQGRAPWGIVRGGEEASAEVMNFRLLGILLRWNRSRNCGPASPYTQYRRIAIGRRPILSGLTATTYGICARKKLHTNHQSLGSKNVLDSFLATKLKICNLHP